MSNQTLNLDDTLYDYLQSVSLREPEVLMQLRQETATLDAAIMQISPEQGQFMRMLTHLIAAKRCIEVGVFTGYSTLCVALALPNDGEIIACDISPEWTEMAQRYWQDASMAHKIKLHLAPAVETLDNLIATQQQNSFDFAFIDADKTNYDAYYERCLQLIRPGGLIAIDNTLWGGDVADESKTDADTVAIRQLNLKLLDDHRVNISLLPIGDGLTLAYKLP